MLLYVNVVLSINVVEIYSVGVKRQDVSSGRIPLQLELKKVFSRHQDKDGSPPPSLEA